MEQNTKPSAELFIATGCHHCPIVLAELSEQLKKGKLSSLNVINIAVDNSLAGKFNIRSVPWFSLSNNDSLMVFSGEHSPKEINQNITTSQNKNGIQEYIEKSLASGEIMNIAQAINIKPEVLSSVITMLGDEETSMDIRIGLDALIEQFAETETLNKYTNELKDIASKNNPRLQIDALHYIALTGDIGNKEFIDEHTKNADKQIKEAAIEALETLNDLLN